VKLANRLRFSAKIGRLREIRVLLRAERVLVGRRARTGR
jgi:hypothetical protein